MNETTTPVPKPAIPPRPNFKPQGVARSHVPAPFNYEGLTHISLPANRWTKVHTELGEVLQPTYNEVPDSFSTFLPALLISPSKPASTEQLSGTDVSIDNYPSCNGGVCLLHKPNHDYWIFNPNSSYQMNMVRIPAFSPEVMNYYQRTIPHNYWRLGNNVAANNSDVTITTTTTLYLASWYRTVVIIQNTGTGGEVARIAFGRDTAAATTGIRLVNGASLTIENPRQRITAFNATGNPTLALQAGYL